MSTYPIFDVNLTERRAIIDMVVNKYQIAADAASSLTEGYLLQEKVFSNSANIYRFNFNSSQPRIVNTINAASPREQLLDLKDAFFATHIGMFLVRDEQAFSGVNKQNTFPDAAVFGLTAAAGYSLPDLEVLWNGFLRFKVNQDELMFKYPSSAFRYSPDTQAGSILSTGTATANATPVIQNSSGRFGYGMVPLAQYYSLFGNNNNEFTLELPQFRFTGSRGVTCPTAGFDHVVQLQLFGFYLVGGSKVANPSR